MKNLGCFINNIFKSVDLLYTKISENLMNFGQGHGLAVWRPSLELSFLTEHYNQVQSHFLIYTTLIYPAKGYHVLFLAHPSCENIMPLHNTLPRYSIEPCHLFLWMHSSHGYPIIGSLLVQNSVSLQQRSRALHKITDYPAMFSSQVLL